MANAYDLDHDYCLKPPASRNIISIDEVSFGRNGINAHGYSQRGVKLFVKKKNARMTTVSVVSACTKDSMIGSKKINGSCDSLKFLRGARGFKQ